MSQRVNILKSALRKLAQAAGVSVTILLALFASPSAYASIFGEENVALSGILAQVTAQVVQGVETIGIMVDTWNFTVAQVEGLEALTSGDVERFTDTAEKSLGTLGLDVGQLRSIADLDYSDDGRIKGIRSDLLDSAYSRLSNRDPFTSGSVNWVAESVEARVRVEAKRNAAREELHTLVGDCNSVYATEQGIAACQMAGSKAAMLGAQAASDSSEQLGHIQRMLELQRMDEDRKRMRELNNYNSFIHSLREESRMLFGGSCAGGVCDFSGYQEYSPEEQSFDVQSGRGW